MQVGDTLEEYLVQATDDAGLRQVLMSMSEAVRTIAFKVCRSKAGLSVQTETAIPIQTLGMASDHAAVSQRRTVPSPGSYLQHMFLKCV